MKKKIYMLLAVCLSAFQLDGQLNPNAPENDFNFWIGEWTVYQNGTENIAGHSKVSAILNGTALLEEYTTPNGQFEGKSLNKYNREERRWEQFWVDNTGLVLHITGGFKDGSMTMSGTQQVNGEALQNRIRWTALEDGSLRQLWEQKNPSQDSWSIAFDGIYRKKS